MTEFDIERIEFWTHIFTMRLNNGRESVEQCANVATKALIQFDKAFRKDQTNGETTD